MKTYLTAESVTTGHPDKLCDLISDSVLDAVLSLDKNAHAAIETMSTKGHIIVAGEITASQLPNIESVVKTTVAGVGYDADSFEITNLIHGQSPDINSAVSKADMGAGDQGIVYGFASNETAEFMPLPVIMAHSLSWALMQARVSGRIPYLKPDGKTQVTVEYEYGIPKRVVSVIISSQHEDGIKSEQLREDILAAVVYPVVPAVLVDQLTEILINPSGRFVLGGPDADTGLTGRKLMVDTYGGLAPHGGGAFSGKDPSKVDRSGAYYARYAAKNIVAASLADRCLICVSYAIGRAQPSSINIECFGTGKVSEDILKDAVLKEFDFRPGAMIEELELKTPFYAETSVGGHFGNSDFPWERTDKIIKLREAVGLGL